MIKNKNGLFFIFMLFLILILNGCASPAKKTGYLNSYDKLSKGKYLENFWVNKDIIKGGKYKTILIEKINVDKISDQRRITTEDCRVCLREALNNSTRPLGGRFIFDNQANQAQAKLEIAITEMTPGSSAGRMFAGEFGMGHAWIQVEGRLIDIDTGQEIIIFSDRRRSSGATGLTDIPGDSGPSLVCGMLRQIAVGMIKEITEAFGF